MGKPASSEEMEVHRISAMDALRASGKLPTASSQHSFTAPPTDNWNYTAVFSDAKRGNHAASGSFLGTSYQQAIDRGIAFPGPGSYDLPNGLVSRATSCTRPSTFVRRSRVSCAPMSSSQQAASLAGADQLLLPPGPDFSGAPPTDMDRAAAHRGSLTSVFASQEGRFVPHGDIHGRHEPRKFEMRRASSARRPRTSVSAAPPLKTSPWVPGMPHPLPRAATAALRAGSLGGGLGEALAFGGWNGGPVSLGYATPMHGRQEPSGNEAGVHGEAGEGSEPAHSPHNWEQLHTAVKSGTFRSEERDTNGDRFSSVVNEAVADKAARDKDTMGAAMLTFSFKGPRDNDLQAGFVPPDRYRTSDTLQQASPGRSRRLVAAERAEDASNVEALENFRPPNTKALRFY